MKPARILLLLSVPPALFALHCGGGAVGDACDEAYADGACEEGAVCAELDAERFVCRPSAAVGEACTGPGHRAECAADAVCGKDESDSLECLRICARQDDCAPSEECNGVEGSSVKGCRPKS